MRKFYFSLTTFVIIILISCTVDLEKEQNGLNQTNNTMSQTFTADSTIVKNAYSIGAMQAALNIIKNRASTKVLTSPGAIKRVSITSDILNNFVIQTSHKYIKFNPSNKIEEDLLKDDENMFLFDYRLDYEYSDEFLLNRPADSDSIPNYYSAVPINKILPNVPYEVLEDLYIPEQDPYFADIIDVDEYAVTYNIQTKSDLFFTLISVVNEQAGTFSNVGYIRQTASNGLNVSAQIVDPNGNPIVAPPVETRIIYGRRWRPVGRIRVEDTSKNNALYPVEGAKVLMRQGFTITSGITNANGEFSTGQVRGRAKYILQWERYHYSIRSGWFGQAETKSPNLRDQNWNCDIIRNLDRHGWYYATIFQAAHDYYYKDILDLHRPQLNNFWNSKMKIAACQSTSYSVHINQLASFGIFPSIYLNVWDKPSEEVYGVTIHELAHSAHREMGTKAYSSLVWKAYIEPDIWFTDTDKYKGAKRLLESWARAVEITLTNLRYRRLGNLNSNYQSSSIDPNGNMQWVPLSFDNTLFTFYTPALFDLTDTFNQRQFTISRPNDNVSGFTIKQVEDVVRDSQSWGEIKEKLVAQYGENGLLASKFLGQWQ